MPTKKIKEKENTTRLYRSETDRVIAGVCGGLGDFFNVDPMLMRLIFVIITVFGGGGVILYIILWLIIPNQSSVSEITKESIRHNADEIKEKAHSFAKDFKINRTRVHSHRFFGLIIIVIGVMFLFGNIGLFRIFDLTKLWPLLLVVIGIAILTKRE
jgi:phage shock protein C